MRKKILVIVFNLERASEHEQFARLMDPHKYEIHYALVRKCGSGLHRFLESNGIRVFCYDYHGKRSLPGLVYRLYRLMNREKYDIVHTHLFESSLAGLVAARIARVRNRIVTRHHSDYHHAYFPSSVKYDRLINSLATRIVAVSSNVRNILISAEHADPAKIITIPHGIDAGEFHPDSVSDERISLIRNKYHLPPAAPVIGVVSRFIAWKGIQFIIPAFMDLKKKYPNALLILANAQGPYIEQVSEMLRVLPAGDYRLIPFEADIPALLNAFTCFVHVPVSETAEAFGQVYIEALAAGVPSVITRSGVALDYAVDGHNCLLVPYRDSAAISLALQRILSSPDLAARLRLHGYEVVGNHYHIRDKYTALSQLYDEMN